MSAPPPADSPRRPALLAGAVFIFFSHCAASQVTIAADGTTIRPDSGATPGARRGAQAPAYEMLIARVLVNTVNKGDFAILRDMQGKILVPATEFDKWGLS